MIRISLSEADRTFHALGVRRVMVDRHGMSLTPLEAGRDYGLWVPDLILLRADGWTLGCRSADEDVAVRLWDGDWIGFKRPEDERFRPIEEYQPKQEV